MTPTTPTPSPPDSTQRSVRRPIRLSGYLELSLEEVLEACSPRAGIDELLSEAFAGALAKGGPTVTVQALPPTWISGDNASIPLSWRVHEDGELVAVGTAALSVLRVQSGRDPLTELLLTLDVAEPAVAAVAPVLRQVLDEVSIVLVKGRAH